jgi:hypothetical protein
VLIYRVIAVIGFFFLVDVIWATVSLHAWIFVFSVVAAFYLLAHLKKLKNKPKL